MGLVSGDSLNGVPVERAPACEDCATDLADDD